MRRHATGSLVLSGVIACALLLGSSGARGTGVDGEVASVVTLQLERVSAARVDAIVTTTVPRTRLTVDRAGRRAAIRSRSFRRPVTRRRMQIPLDSRTRTTLIVTAGPRTP